MNRALAALALLAGCVPAGDPPSPPVDSDRPDTARASDSDTLADSDSDTRVDTDPPGDTDTDPPADTDTDPPADTDTDQPADTDTPADSDSDTRVDTDPAFDTDSDPPVDTDSRVDTDTPSGTDTPVDSTPRAHTDLPVDTTPPVDSTPPPHTGDSDTNPAVETDPAVDTTAADSRDSDTGPPHTDPRLDTDVDGIDTSRDTAEDIDTDTADTDEPADTTPPPPPRPPGCLIPAPGSWASYGALTTNHLLNGVDFPQTNMSSRLSSDRDNDGALENLVNMLSNYQVPTSDPGYDYGRASLIDVSTVTGFVPFAQTEVWHVQLDYRWAHAFWDYRDFFSDFDSDGNDEYTSNVKRSIGVSYSIPIGAWEVDAVADETGPLDYLFGASIGAWTRGIYYAAAGDFNSDGFPDLLAIGNNYGGDHEGVMVAGPFTQDPVLQDWSSRIFASFDTYSSPGMASPSRPLVQDFDEDGHDDFAISWHTGITTGEFRIFYGPFFGLLDINNPDSVIHGTTQSRYKTFGHHATPSGDINGDGHQDLLLGSASEDWQSMPEAGGVYIFHGPIPRGTTWLDTDAYAQIRWSHAWARLGAPTYLGDIDGNGTDDFAVVAYWAMSEDEPPDRRLPIAPLPPGAPPDPVCVPAATAPPPFPSAGDTDDDSHSAPHTGDTATPSCTVVPDPFWTWEEGAIAVFSNPGPGLLGPEDALFVIKGDRPGAAVATNGIVANGDLDHDGFADFTFMAFETLPDGSRVNRLYIVKPCADFGQVVGP